MSEIQPLPVQLYLSSTVREGEEEAAQARNIPMFELMQRAGQSVFSVIQELYQYCHHILVVAGKGNNGGDGYIIARLARQAGYKVTLWQMGDPQSLSGDALRAQQLFLDGGGKILPPNEQVAQDVDLIVDGILGTGIKGHVRPQAQALINTLNASKRPVIAIDTPSGLDTNTGRILGSAIKANITVTFIAVKQGLVTGQARRVTGEILFAGLGVEDEFVNQNPPAALLTNPSWLNAISQREADSHKGNHGRLLIAGGGEGMSGAAYLATAASLRAGVGLAALICHDTSGHPIRSMLPEAMIANQDKLPERLDWCSVVCLGMGLGRNAWSEDIFNTVAQKVASNRNIPKVIDADGLYWLSQQFDSDSPWQNLVITPHPGEAAMLLGCQISDVETDRYQAALSLSEKYQCITVLKGAGTLICDGDTTVVCHAGNAGMATGGMGDVLAGTIAALLGQGYPPMRAATLGTLIHSMAADIEAKRAGKIGLLASDLLPAIRSVINSKTHPMEQQ
ncbi:NAD(P)H-hydrate dehydratase [Vibrio mexicanus]|uniref:NAD(P)H-hydrate dehydratase n=1 Tax=Vibrio mexicanus TaxID=1004326 RepID=UPI00063C294F|nr:NAD(P)H-hydrate dehydratase [Vibrio mexicanus]